MWSEHQPLLVHPRASVVASRFDYLHGVIPLAIGHVQARQRNAAIPRRRTAAHSLLKYDLVPACATALENTAPSPLFHADIVVPKFSFRFQRVQRTGERNLAS